MSDARDRSPAPRSDVYLALSQLDDAEFAYVVGLIQGTMPRPAGGADGERLRELLRSIVDYITKRGTNGRGSADEQVRAPAESNPD